MSELAERMAALSPERRALFEALLAEERERETKNRGEEAAVGLPRIVPAPQDRYAPFPPTDMQQALWIGRSGALELGQVSGHMYFELDGCDLDLERLERAWQRLIDRHDLLRATVQASDGQLRVLEQVPPYRIAIADLRSLSAEGRARRLDELRHELSHQVLPADRWPLFEIRASRLHERSTRVHISFDLLVADAWSFQFLMGQWGELYRDPGKELPRLEISFRDYRLAELAIAGTELHRRSEEYWQKRIPDLPAAPELPLSTQPRAMRRQRFENDRLNLPAERWQRLKALAGQAGLTPSGVLLAAFAEVLGAWSKSASFTLVVTIFKRLPLHPQVTDILGHFTTTTPLAIAMPEPGESFRTRARRVQEQLWEDLTHQHVSGIRVLRDLVRVQRRSAGAVMPVVFTSTVGHYSGTAETDSPLAWLGELEHVSTQAPQVWLDNQVVEDRGALVVNWESVEGLFPSGVAREMFHAYSAMLERLAAGTEAWDAPVDVSIPLEQIERRATANATAGGEPTLLLHESIQARARERPDAVAVVNGTVRLTYGELVERARRIARVLRDRGVRPNQLVGVVMEKGWEQVAGAVGIVAAGGAYLPIDPEIPLERLAYLLENGGTEIVLTQRRVADRTPWPAGVAVLSVDDDSAWASAVGGELESVQSRDDLAYVIYTSGSTGQPKGVMISHRGAANTIADVNERFDVGWGDRVFALSSLSFDLSVYDVFGALAAGATVVMPAAERSRDPAHWADLLESEQVTIWNSVPALMELLVDYAEGRPGGIAASVRLVLLSGDWIGLSLPERVRRALPSARVISLGGATEASIWSILFPVDRVEEGWPSIPYGQAMRNQSFHVLNERLQPCPDWVTGELYIGGIGLARGYWRDEEKTRQRFVRVGDEVLYRTGDLGRWLPDGNIEFLGREDQQVKINGYRIELGEVEAALGSHPAVRDVVAVVATSEGGGRRLAAYVVPASEHVPEESDLRAYARSKLPDYMVPSRVLFLDAVPLTPNGKVDRRGLLDLDRAARAVVPEYVAPRTELEEHLVRVWSEVLGVDRVGVEDDFIALGGDSQKAIQLLSHLHNLFGIEMPLDRFLDADTIVKQAEIVEEVLLAEIDELSEEEAVALSREA
jgi:pyochelin synthetase